MNNLLNVIKVELFKILSSRTLRIVAGLVLIIQPLIAMMNARDILNLGLDASPITHPQLIQALPPKEYLGFYDILPFGLLPMIVLGGIIGAGEYQNHQLRTTLLCCSNRIKVYVAKIISSITCFALLSFISIYLTIVVTHFCLGDIGLNPITLSVTTRSFIGYAILEWSLLTMLAYFIGLICRNAIVPFVFLIPQIYGLAPYIASKWNWGKYLPVTAGKLLTAVPTDTLVHAPIQGGLILGVWVMILLSLAMYTFTRRDVGGIY